MPSVSSRVLPRPRADSLSNCLLCLKCLCSIETRELASELNCFVYVLLTHASLRARKLMHESISFGSDEWEPMPESDLSSQIRNN